MMKRLSQKEIFARDNVHIYSYSLNQKGIRLMEMGSLFLFVIAASIYPFTHFEPRAWMIAPVILTIAGFILLVVAQKWRRFAQQAFLAYDDTFLFIGNNPNAAICIPWEKLTVKSSGLANENSGANLKMIIDDEPVNVRLFTNAVCIPEFEAVLYTILTHVKTNELKLKEHTQNNNP